MKKHTEARLKDAIIDPLTTQGGFVFVHYREGPCARLSRRSANASPKRIVVRGDSGFCREELLVLCERERDLYYVAGLPKNPVLVKQEASAKAGQI